MPEKNKEEQAAPEETPKENKTFSLKIPGALAALLITLAFMAPYAYMFSEFEQIPGPLYGGDYYFHYGIVKHIASGNPVWTCPQVYGEYAFYPWLLHLSVAVIGFITGDTLKAFVYQFPLLVMLATGLVVYFLGRFIFKNEGFALLLCLAWVGFRSYVGHIPSSFTPTLTLPLFLLAVIYALNTEKIRDAAIAGVAFALFMLSHASALPAGGFLLFLLFLYYALNGNVSLGVDKETTQMSVSVNREALKAASSKALRTFAPMVVVGLLIGMLYWYPVLFVYHFKILNPWNDYTMPDYNRFGGQIMVETFVQYLFNYPRLLESASLAGSGATKAAVLPLTYFVISVLTSVGIAAAYINRKEKGAVLLLAAFFSGLVGYFHYLITMPLLGTHYVPVRFEKFMLEPAAFILAIYALYFIYGRLRMNYSKNALLAAAFIFFILVSAVKIEIQYNDKWTMAGRSQENAPLLALQNWVENNTDKNAVFLSHEELSFALNGITGRKVVAERRTHYNPYVDIDERLADSAVMLYGNDSRKSLELMKKYNVSYVYWDYMWMHPDYSFAMRQPTMTRPEYAEYLSQYNVTFQAGEAYLDPAFDKYHKRYPVLVIYPARMDFYAPWSEAAGQNLKLVTSIDVEGTSLYRIYEVDYGAL